MHELSWRRLRPRLVAPLSPVLLALTVIVLAVADWADRRVGDAFFPGALFDETAHLATAILLLGLLPQRFRDRFLGPALIGSVVLDLDHVPGYLGNDFLTNGTPRPYPHSLLTVVVILLAGLCWRRRRVLLLGLAVGVGMHLMRDLAEGGSGVPLLWPFSDHAYSYPHSVYLAIMAVAAAVDLAKWRAARSRSAAAPRGPLQGAPAEATHRG